MTGGIERRDAALGPRVRPLYEIAQSFESVEGADARVRRALELLRRLVAYDCCALLEAQPGRKHRLTVTSEAGDGGHDAHQSRVLDDTHGESLPIGEDRRVLRDALGELLGYLSEPQARSSAGEQRVTGMLSKTWCTHLAVPLVGLDQVIGILFVGRAGKPYEEQDLCFLSQVAAQTAAYLTTLRLYQNETVRARELDTARREAEAANRAKDEFVAMISHELKTPLNAILGWARLLRSEPLGGVNHARAIETIVRNAKAQARIIEDLLDLSRITTGKVNLALVPIEPAKVVEAAIEAARPQAEIKSIRLACALDPTTGPVLADAGRLQQVVSNLLANAIKFTPGGGSIEVQIERVAGHVRIQVRDTGRGISPEVLPSIFVRFRQADPTSRREHDGLGLGLAIVANLVELHGGRVHAESLGEGKGATFTVELPLAEGAVEASAPESRGTSDGSATKIARELEGIRVLVVDDEPDTREVIKAVLEHFGADVVLAGSAAEALAALERSLPDVILSDISMPGEDGYDLVRQVKALEARRGVQLPVAALTALSGERDRARVREAGFLMHLTKPIEPARLVAAVARLAVAR